MSEVTDIIRQKYLALQGLLNESTRRRWAAAEARALGRGGITKVSQATGINPATIRVGLAELDAPPPPPAPAINDNWGGSRKKGGYRSSTPRVRAPGGGRKPVTATDPTLLTDLDALIEPAGHTDSTTPLRWTCKSTREIARTLRDGGHRISQQKVSELLRELGFSLRGPSSLRGGREHPDCTLQFQHLHATILEFLSTHQPVIVVEARKDAAEVLRNNPSEEGGRDERHRKELEKAASAPETRDTTAPPAGSEQALNFLVAQTIRTWWATMGAETHPKATRLLIAAAWAGSVRAKQQWALELQPLADKTGITLHVCHVPAGARKWSGATHRLQNLTSQLWADRPSGSWEVLVTSIEPTPGTVLLAQADPDQPSKPAATYPSSAEIPQNPSLRESVSADWNYSITPLSTGSIS